MFYEQKGHKDMVFSTEDFLESNNELDSIGLINDMYAESRNDDCKYAELATQEDFDRF